MDSFNDASEIPVEDMPDYEQYVIGIIEYYIVNISRTKRCTVHNSILIHC